MDKHRMVWMKAHSDKDIVFMEQASLAGFDVHHIDGNHENNDPDNLLMIFGEDHCKLHGRGNFGREALGFKDAEQIALEKLSKGKIAYEARVAGYTCVAIASEYGIKSPTNCAKYYAIQNGLKWPVGPSKDNPPARYTGAENRCGHCRMRFNTSERYCSGCGKKRELVVRDGSEYRFN